MLKSEYDKYVTEQKIRMEKRYLTRLEREKLKHMIDNPKLYIKEETKPQQIKKIITDINELRKPCQEVTKEDNIKSIIQELKDTLQNSPTGLGLSTNQIGYNKKICYLRIPKSFNQKTREVGYTELVLINPIIIEKERQVTIKNEGCLSLPGIQITTDRYVFITVTYLDENLKENTGTFQDLESFATQHEIDHLNGLIILDRKHRSKL